MNLKREEKTIYFLPNKHVNLFKYLYRSTVKHRNQGLQMIYYVIIQSMYLENNISWLISIIPALRPKAATGLRVNIFSYLQV